MGGSTGSLTPDWSEITGALSVTGIEPLSGAATTDATGGGTCISPSGSGPHGINQTSTVRIAIANKTLRTPHCLRARCAAEPQHSYCGTHGGPSYCAGCKAC